MTIIMKKNYTFCTMIIIKDGYKKNIMNSNNN